MDIKEIAEQVSKRIYVEDGLLLSKFISEKFAEALIAELAKGNEPRAFLHEWIEYHPFGDTFAGEPCATITNDEKPFDSSDTVYPLFTYPPTAEQIAKQNEPVDYTPGEWFMCYSIDQMQAFYMSRLPAIREAAKEHGYAIGLHGSARRDFDLMAMPWRDGCSSRETLAHAVAQAACGIDLNGEYQWEKKPNGRWAVSMCICWTDHSEQFKGMLSVGHIDLSVMEPPAASQIEQETAEACAKLCINQEFYVTRQDAAEAIRSGAWKEFK